MSRVPNSPELLSGNPLADFGTYYRKIIRPYLVDLEKKRETLKAAPADHERKLLMMALGIGIFLGACSYQMGLLGDYRIAFSLLLVFMPLLAMKYWLSPVASMTLSQASKDEYNDFYVRFKSKVVESLIRFFDPSLKLAYDKSISKDDLSFSGLVPKAQMLLLEGDDYASGVVEGMPVAFSELKLSLITKETEADIFHGLCLNASMKQIMEGSVYVIPKTWLGGVEPIKVQGTPDTATIIHNMAANWGKFMPWSSGEVRESMPFGITLFHVKASQHYEVYTTNRLLAGKMASDQLWDLLFSSPASPAISHEDSPLKDWTSHLRMQQAVQQNTGMSLVNGRLCIMFPQGTELFEPNLDHTFLDEEGLMQYQQSLSKVLQLAKLISLHVGKAY